MDTAIQKAEEKMAYVSYDKEALRAYQMREMALSDWTSGLNHAREEGIQEGREEGIQEGIQEGRLEGIQEGRLEVAKKALAEGAAEELVSKITGLDMDTISRLRPEKNDP
jgi:predicted transposase/invertase (TIGR01784 family)